VPQAFKEPPPEGWKEAQPNDGSIRGKWWEIYNDPQLNALEEQVSLTNQNVLAAEGQFRAARESVRVARAALYPTGSVTPSITRSHTPSSSGGQRGGTNNLFSLSGSAAWTADIWGSIRRSVHASQASAQASYADLESARLALQSELAQDYLELHGSDGDVDLLERTAKSYEEYLVLTQNRFRAGVASGADVAQAQTQLDTTRADLIDLGVARAQFEHAIAVLTGHPPADLTLPRAVLRTPPPPIPLALPSVLLERRPDVAAAERTMASLNEQIGIAIAAYYPTLSLSAIGGFTANSGTAWFSAPSRFWSLGAQLSELVFDGGKRKAQIKVTEAQYDTAVANYRQTVLTAFQQVEDDLATLRILAEEAIAVDRAVKAAQESLDISTYQYKAGTVAYLQVITAQAAALQEQRAAVDVLTRRMVSSVLLIQALGGGWDRSNLPSPDELTQGSR
jgi:NodT family efflux transporter outer membrane factor (OMF) lipoprotein